MEKRARVFTPSEILKIEQLLECRGLVVELRDAWGTMLNSDHRLQIRRALAQYLADVDVAHPQISLEFPIWASSLETLPASPHHFISISHGYRLGGYALCDKSTAGSGLGSGLGFDLETLSRITPAIVERVSHPLEQDTAPDPRFLWSAKEACFKASLGPQQPVAITEIRTENWISVSEYFHTFNASTLRHNLGRGILSSHPRNDEVFAFFLGIADPLLT